MPKNGLADYDLLDGPRLLGPMWTQDEAFDVAKAWKDEAIGKGWNQ